MDENVNIKISSTADTKGFEQTKQATDEIIGKKHKWREAIHGVALEYPVLGHLGRLALSPISAAVGLAVLAFAKMQAGIKQLQDAIKLADWDSFESALAASQKRLQESALEAEAYQRSLTAIANATQTVTDKTKGLIATLQHKARLETELTDAEEAAALAQIDAQEQIGKLSGPAAIQQRMEIQRSAARQREQIRIKEQTDTIAARQAERAALKAEKGQLDTGIAGQETKLAGMVSPEDIDAQIARVTKNLAAAGKPRDTGVFGALPGVSGAVGGLQQTDVDLQEQMKQQLAGLQAVRGPRAVEFQTEQERLKAMRTRRTAVGERESAAGGELDEFLRGGLLEDQFRGPTARARTTARETGPLSEQTQQMGAQAFALNQATLATQGQQLGETVGEAVSIAIKSAGAPMTDAIVQGVTKVFNQLAVDFERKLAAGRPTK